MDEIPLSTLFLILLVLVCFSAFFSGSETALMAANRYRMRHLANSGHHGARSAQRLLQAGRGALERTMALIEPALPK